MIMSQAECNFETNIPLSDQEPGVEAQPLFCVAVLRHAASCPLVTRLDICSCAKQRENHPVSGNSSLVN